MHHSVRCSAGRRGIRGPFYVSWWVNDKIRDRLIGLKILVPLGNLLSGIHDLSCMPGVAFICIMYHIAIIKVEDRDCLYIPHSHGFQRQVFRSLMYRVRFYLACQGVAFARYNLCMYIHNFSESESEDRDCLCILHSHDPQWLVCGRSIDQSIYTSEVFILCKRCSIVAVSQQYSQWMFNAGTHSFMKFCTCSIPPFSISLMQYICLIKWCPFDQARYPPTPVGNSRVQHIYRDPYYTATTSGDYSSEEFKILMLWSSTYYVHIYL